MSHHLSHQLALTRQHDLLRDAANHRLAAQSRSAAISRQNVPGHDRDVRLRRAWLAGYLSRPGKRSSSSIAA